MVIGIHVEVGIRLKHQLQTRHLLFDALIVSSMKWNYDGMYI